MPNPARPGRRAVLRTGVYAVGAAALGAPLTGCGVRVEPPPSGFPDLPFVPESVPAAGQAAVLLLWNGTLELRDAALAASTAAGDLPAQLAGLASDQGQVLQAALDAMGVSADDQARVRVDGDAGLGGATGSPTGGATGGATGGPTGAPTGGATTPGDGSTTALADDYRAGLSADVLEAAGEVPVEVFPSAATSLAQRGAAAELLGSPVEWPDGRWEDPTAAQGLLDALWAAAYGFEMVVAQVGTGSADLAETTLSTLRTRRRLLSEVLGQEAAPPPPGYALPFSVATPAAADRLAEHVLTGLRTSLAAGLGPVRGAPGGLPDALAALAEAEVLASRWRLPLMALPGLG